MIITKTDNIFLHAAFSGYGKKESSFSVEKIITFFIENELHQKYNIHEKILIQEYNQQKEVGLFYLLFKAGYTNYSKDFLQKLIQIHLQFDPFSYVYGEKYSNVLFSSGYFAEDKTILVMKEFIEQYGENLFVEQIKKENTLKKAIQYNYYDMIEFLLKYIDIDDVNFEGETAIFYAKNLKMVDFLNQYHPNWNIVNNMGQDCLFSFSGLNNKEGNLMVKYVSDIRKNKNKKEDVQSIYNVFFHMIEKKQTKQQLENFIKKYPNIDFSQAENEKKIFVVNCLIQKKELGKIDLLKNIDFYKENENNNNIFLEIMKLDYRALSTTKQKQFLNLLMDLTKNPEKNMSFLFYQKWLNYLIETDDIYQLISNLITIKKENPKIFQEVLKIFEQDEDVFNFKNIEKFYQQSTKSLELYTNKSLQIEFIIHFFEKIIQKYNIPDIDELQMKIVNELEYNSGKNQLFFLDQLIHKIDEKKGTNFVKQQWNSINEFLEKKYNNNNNNNNKKSLSMAFAICQIIDHFFKKNTHIENNEELKDFINIIDKKWIDMSKNEFENMTNYYSSINGEELIPFFHYFDKMQLEKELKIKSDNSFKYKI
jgi:hypothetical protein